MDAIIDIPEQLYYTPSHGWVHVGFSGEATIGITRFGYELVGEVDSIALPIVGDKVVAQQPCIVLESSKVVCDILAPVTGVVTGINSELVEDCTQLNQRPSATWLVRIRMSSPSETRELLDFRAYRRLIEAAEFPA